MRSGFDVGAKRLQPRHQPLDFAVGQQAGAAEAAHVGDRPDEVVDGQRPVDFDRAREVGDERVVLRAEPAAPEPHRPSCTWCGAIVAAARAAKFRGIFPADSAGYRRGRCWTPPR